MEDKIKECKNLSVDDCCMELDPCGLTPCQHIKDCYYKQLLAEQAKNKELENALEQQKQYCRDFKLFQIKNVDDLQAKNKKLVEALEKIAYRDITIKSNFYSSTVANEALNEVNK